MLKFVKWKGSLILQFLDLYIFESLGCRSMFKSNVVPTDNLSSMMDVIFCFLISYLQFSCRRSSPRLWNARQVKGKSLEKRAARSFMDVLQEVTLSYKFVSCHVYILIVGYLKDFYSGTVTGKSRIPASSCPNIFEGWCGSTKHFISTALLFSLW